MTVHKWQFAPRFRRNAFGWKSDTPIQRIKEAVSEIKQVVRKDPELAAEGAVVFLEKLTPAIEQVDSSSGAISTAVHRAIETLVPIIAKAKVDAKVRNRWLVRLWQAIQDDGISYIESLADHWGDMCADPNVAKRWIEEFKPMVEYAWRPHSNGHGYYNGTAACLSAMLAAGQYEQLLALLELAPHPLWHDRRWGVKALTALGKKAEAIRYAEASRGLTQSDWQISEICEEILLSSGLADEAYQRYAIAANQGTTNLATFRAIAKKYPHKAPTKILRDLAASTPGAEGKWFAAAKDAGLFDVAIELARRSPTDPRTLIRAARDFAIKRPEFAIATGLSALGWMARGYGYEITVLDVYSAYDAVMEASLGAGMDSQQIKTQVHQMIDVPPSGVNSVQKILQSKLSP
ncbi:hypothetical protein SAMN05660284_02020 [Formivibrio citricus]|uniref:Uncharacterized protein n=1 Tax=Formivibrio citricus TaxID=83765 RepID=A0A1I5AWZ4_9NEIS|nr:hypothetical protein [Formivibrio citricus]SFN66964.1 hypothetical protein SAMN05660284_02020 [Formivibrio citricus]